MAFDCPHVVRFNQARDFGRIAPQILSQTYRTVEALARAGALYLAMNDFVARLVAVLERRLSPHLRRGIT
jgi:octopine/nopaline transport system permease protein